MVGEGARSARRALEQSLDRHAPVNPDGCDLAGSIEEVRQFLAWKAPLARRLLLDQTTALLEHAVEVGVPTDF